MSEGSHRFTVRIGDELRAEMEETITRLNANPMAKRSWTLSEFIVQAIVEKLSHDKRSRGERKKVTAEKPDENMPREIQEVDI